LAAGCGGGAGGNNSGYAGVYAATWSESALTATVTITQISETEVEAAWQVPPNPPSGTIDFALSTDGDGNTVGTAVGTATGGSCFTGDINGNTQTNCCTSCSITFSENGFVQPNAGTVTGVTPAGVEFSGTYSGAWVGTKE
jgi:hypothetical protein